MRKTEVVIMGFGLDGDRWSLWGLVWMVTGVEVVIMGFGLDGDRCRGGHYGVWFGW
jgi:hypothetical protein